MMRTEHDALGTVDVPVDRYYGAQTERARRNFQVGSERFPPSFIHALALVKKAAAAVNARLGGLDPDVSETIQSAAQEVVDGKHDDHFPLVIWQSGSGTQTNMNVNEVIANRSNELLGEGRGTYARVHPNDHVNMSQSTNDTVPTAMHIAATLAIRRDLLPALDGMIAALAGKAEAFKTLVKLGRTHLQDATPLTLGQEFSGYVTQLQQARRALANAVEDLSALAIGGTAVGTGLNTVAGYDIDMAREISRLTGESFRVLDNKFAGLAAHDAIVRASGTLRALAAALMKIANDLRWMGSGPRSGLGELKLPANEPGSSIMPGKVNPTQCEMLTMVCAQVYGNDAAIGLAGSQGNFELNVYKPLFVHLILQSITLLSDACTSFTENCVAGIDANEDRIRQHLESSLMLVTALNRHIGYENAAKIALKAWHDGTTLREAATTLGLVSEEEYDKWVRPENMLGPQ